MGALTLHSLERPAAPIALRCEAAIMFAELRNFTRMSEMLPPERALVYPVG